MNTKRLKRVIQEIVRREVKKEINKIKSTQVFTM